MLIVGIAAAMAFVVLHGPSDQTTYTLYRDSMTGAAMRIHVATFDAGDGEEYNRINCGLVQEQMKRRLEVKVRYWCEKGRFKQ